MPMSNSNDEYKLRFSYSPFYRYLFSTKSNKKPRLESLGSPTPIACCHLVLAIGLPSQAAFDLLELLLSPLMAAHTHRGYWQDNFETPETVARHILTFLSILC